MNREMENNKNKPLHPLTERFREIKRQNIEQSKKDKDQFLKEKASRKKHPEKKIARPQLPEAGA